MPFEIGTLSVTLFALPQELPEDYIDLLNGRHRFCERRAGDRLGLRTLSAGSKNRAEHRAMEQSDLHQSAQSRAQDSIFYAKGMVPAGGTGLDARQRTQQRVLETEEAN